MTWRAIVPLNYGRDCKTRLAATLSPAERNALAIAMAQNVIGALAKTPDIGTIHVISPERPPLQGFAWIMDQDRGLNAALATAREAIGEGAVLFIHADLPEVGPDDITALLTAAETNGAAIAPDETGQGTNALAIADDRDFVPAFGADSFARHRLALPEAAIVKRHGLAHDVDEPDSLVRMLVKGAIAPPI